MSRLLVILFLLSSLSAAPAALNGRIIKTLPLFLDLKGRDAVSPSLYDRDAYQVFLRQHTNQISAVRFDVLWKASDIKHATLKLRAELRGIGDGGMPSQAVLERQLTPKFFRRWTSLTLAGDDYKKVGEIVA